MKTHTHTRTCPVLAAQLLLLLPGGSRVQQGADNGLLNRLSNLQDRQGSTAPPPAVISWGLGVTGLSYFCVCEASCLRIPCVNTHRDKSTSLLPAARLWHLSDPWASSTCHTVLTDTVLHPPSPLSGVVWPHTELTIFAAAFLQRFLTRPIDVSTRSRMIWSTSRPWYPTSVNLVASTCKASAAKCSSRCSSSSR